YPDALEMPIYTSGMFRQQPAPDEIETLLREGEAAARRSGDAGSLARLLALGAYRSHDPHRLIEALRLSEGLRDTAGPAAFLSHAAILQTRVGDFAMAERLYQRLDTLASTSAPADVQLEFRAILALSTGRLPEAERLAARFLDASASRGPHLRTHSLRE